MSLEHWMMFGTFAEKDYFVYPHRNTYDGVIINANMVSHASAGVASFLIEKIPDGVKYIVDPITHAFQHDPCYIKNKEGKIKASLETLAEHYGDTITCNLGQGSIKPEKLDSDSKEIDLFSKKVLAFQRDHLRQKMLESEVAKYLDEKEIKSPFALIAPYFYMTETTYSKWIRINAKCIKSSKSHLESNEKLFAEIVVDKGIILDEQISEEIINTYRELSQYIDGIVLWIDSFDEQEASVYELKAMKKFCGNLKAITPTIINLHGGYFSIMLGGKIGDKCLSGVTHGPEFGEYRSVVPVGGGIPISRYYIPRLHSRIRYRDALMIFNNAKWLESTELFSDNVCDCPVCTSTLSEGIHNFSKFGEGEVKNIKRKSGMIRIEYPFTETKIRCLKHYLERKNREYKMIRNADAETIMQELRDTIRAYSDICDSNQLSHLIRWEKVLSK